MDALISGVRIAGMEPGGEPYGTLGADAVAFEGGRIAWIGASSSAPACARRIEGRGRWLTPALIDCHTHLVYAGDRAREFERRLSGATYEEIARSGGGIATTVSATRAATEEELVALALPRARAIASEGATAIEIKSGYGLDVESELKMLRAARRLEDLVPVMVRTTLLALHAVPPEFRGRADAYVDLVCKELLPAAVEARLVHAVDAFCEHIAFSPEQAERVFRAAKDHALPVKIHAEQLSNLGGARLAARYRALSADHLEYLDEAGVEAMAEAGTVAVLLPGAFLFLGETRRPPIESLRRHRVPIAIATDHNPGTSPYTSLLLMLNLACSLFRLTPEEALAGVTREAARALGMGASHGTVSIGKRADVLLWDIEHPSQLAYSFGTHRPAIFRNGEAVPAP